MLQYVIIWIFCSSVFLAQGASDNDNTRALLYLIKYGYLAPRNESSALLTQERLDQYLTSAVKDFQAFAGVPATGDLDPLTVELMGTPRCGVRDIIGHGATARRKKRYVLQGSKWKVKTLTYRITQYPGSGLTDQEVDETMTQAFKLWSDVTDLTFIRETQPGQSVHIEIKFVSYEHGDGDPFDGPGGTLAHAYFPAYGGDMHVDDSELWTINSFRGTNLLQTLTHELGHSLGLSHSDVNSAVMAPFYKGWQPNFVLDPDDVQAIQALYGSKETKPTASPGPTSGPEITLPGTGTTEFPGTSGSSLCSSAAFDAILRTSDGISYVFRDENYWKLTSESVAAGYPRKILSDWSGLPNNIQAGFTWQDTKATYIFKGSLYWKFINMEASPGYPKSIKDGFPGVPDDIDTAFVWSGNNKIYFFKDNQYWKFDPARKPHVRTDRYPKSISEWGLPPDIDGALQWDNRRTYFFKQGEYWRFNDRRFAIDRSSTPFPRPTGPWWFGCPRTQPLLNGHEEINVIASNNIDNSFDIDNDKAGNYEDVGNEVLDVDTY